ncbi:transaldolase [Methanolacinia petrolearia DSM 11571]|uniref:Probable transaldolase n=1 Tax=Methanolacinia petrolearia (strain DSM 11571 / OCM 486 / SEBR 4847) TaxID=679926 RepID=E1REX3_METP4|nr:fructose-6-phosphate aldolase [Methanolacinia petrolearia]ADN36144.1 transaldolase [Methanolacinia petrolearia DSM 11571]
MKFFIDTANIDEIRIANDWGIIDGVTTNPSLVAKEEKDFRALIEEILGIVNGPISVEVISTDTEGMVKEALDISQWSENIVVKIPMIPEGLKAIKILHNKGIKTNATLIFSVNQALMAAKAGANYVSPFIGRLDDIGQDGLQIIRDLREIFSQYDLKNEIIVASIRHPLHVVESAKAGAHVATIPFGVIEKMFKHPLTDSGLNSFLKDWNKTQK